MKTFRLQLLLLSATCLAAPYLYAQCVGQANCQYSYGLTACSGSLPSDDTSEGAQNQIWLTGFDHCGLIYIAGVPTSFGCLWQVGGLCA